MTPPDLQAATSSCLIAREASEMSVSPLQNSSKPPPVPDVPTVMFTPEFSPLKASAAAEVRGPTVEEPSIVMSPERSDGRRRRRCPRGGVVVAAAAGGDERANGERRRGGDQGESASTCHLVVLLSGKGGPGRADPGDRGERNPGPVRRAGDFPVTLW